MRSILRACQKWPERTTTRKWVSPMKKQSRNSQKVQTSKPSKERTGIDRLYKYTGARKVSYYYQYPDGTSETLSSATLGDRAALAEAERTAKRKALDIQQGQIVAGSVDEVIARF